VNARPFLLVAIVVCALGAAAPAFAYFGASSAPGGAGRAVATTVQQANTPTATVGAGRAVTVSWAASTLANGVAVDGYTVARYDSGTDVLQVIGAGCQGTIASTSCTENSVPIGSWTYRVTATKGTNWTGAASAASGTVVVNGVSLSLAKTTLAAADFTPSATLTGSLAGFGAGESIVYRLDSSSGTILSGSPTAANGSGNASVSITLPKPSEGSHTIYAVGGSGSLASSAIVVDTVAPATGATGADSAWHRSTVTVTLSATDAAPSTGVASIAYTVDGGSTQTISSTSGNVVVSAPGDHSNDGTHTISFHATDNAGNVESPNGTATVKIDTTGPVQSLSLASASGAYASGSTVFWKSNTTGSFKVADVVTDSASGPASAAYPAIATTGWTHNAETVTTGSGSAPAITYTSSLYSWTASASAPADQTVTAADTAGNTAASSLQFVADVAAPSGGSVDASGLVGTGSRYSTSTSLSIAFAKGSDGGSGLAATGALLQRAQATLTNGSCGSYGSYTTIATDPTSPYTDTAPATNACFSYHYLVTDNVGNTTTYSSGDVKVQTTAPPSLTPSFAFSALSGSVAAGANNTIYYKQNSTGSFTITATASDATSGLASYSFPTAPTGWTESGSGAARTYSYTAAAGSPTAGTQTITATDNATLTASTTLTLTADNAGPSGGSVDAASLVGTGARYSNALSLSVAFAKGSDPGSGVASTGALLQRAQGTLSAGACTGYGSFATIATDPSSPLANTVPANNACYQYRYVVADNVGNSTTYTSGDVKVETTAPGTLTPTASLSAATGNTFISGTTVYVNAQAGKSGGFAATSSPTDATSGILKVNFPSLTGFTSGGGDVSSSPYTTTYAWSGAVSASGAQTVTATDNASLTATSSFTVTADVAAPSGGSVDASGLVGTGSRYSTSTSLSIAFAKGSDGGSGLAATGALLQRAQATLTNGSCGSYGSYTTIATDPTSPYTDTAPATNACFSYHYLVTDNVGNTTTYSSGDVKVQTTAPPSLTPSFAFSALSGSVAAGANNTIYYKQNSTGSFTITATASDATSGLASYSFPTAPTGWTESGSGAARTYSYTAAAGSPTAGTQTITATDNATLTASTTLTLTADNAVAVTAIALANGGTSGTAGTGDTATIIFSAPIKASTFCSAWTSDTSTQTLSNITLTLTNTAGNDTLSVTTSPSCTFTLGTIATGANYTTANITFSSSTIAWDPAARTLTVTLGTPSTTTGLATGVAANKPKITPATGLTDLVGNALPTTAFTSGSATGW
jgi:hypothetical protein